MSPMITKPTLLGNVELKFAIHPVWMAGPLIDFFLFLEGWSERAVGEYCGVSISEGQWAFAQNRRSLPWVPADRSPVAETLTPPPCKIYFQPPSRP